MLAWAGTRLTFAAIIKLNATNCSSRARRAACTHARHYSPACWRGQVYTGLAMFSLAMMPIGKMRICRLWQLSQACSMRV